jgi:hypothetical protein
MFFDHFDNFRDEIIISTNCFLSIGTQTIDCKIRDSNIYLLSFDIFKVYRVDRYNFITIIYRYAASFPSAAHITFFFLFENKGNFQNTQARLCPS